MTVEKAKEKTKVEMAKENTRAIKERARAKVTANNISSNSISSSSLPLAWWWQLRQWIRTGPSRRELLVWTLGPMSI